MGECKVIVTLYAWLGNNSVILVLTSFSVGITFTIIAGIILLKITILNFGFSID